MVVVSGDNCYTFLISNGCDGTIETMTQPRAKLRFALMRRSLRSRLFFCSSLAVASSARADEHADRTSALSWIRLPGADACVPTQELAREVERRLGRAVFVPAASADVSVEGHIAPNAARTGWEAHFILRDAKGLKLGVRDLKQISAQCTKMTDALSLVVALMIDPDAAVKVREPEPEPKFDPVPQAAPARAPVPEPPTLPALPEPSSPPAHGWRIDTGASVSLGAGLLPGVAVGLAADAIVDIPGLAPVHVIGAFWPNSTETAPGGDASGQFSLAYVGGGACPIGTRKPSLSLDGCGNAHLGLLRSNGAGFSVARDAEQHLYVALSAEMRLSIRVFGPLRARAGLAGVVPLLRDRFTYRDTSGNQTEIFRQTPVVLSTEFGLGLVLP